MYSRSDLSKFELGLLRMRAEVVIAAGELRDIQLRLKQFESDQADLARRILELQGNFRACMGMFARYRGQHAQKIGPISSAENISAAGQIQGWIAAQQVDDRLSSLL